MTGRTFVAGAPPPAADGDTSDTPGAPHWDAEAALWSLLCDLWELATERRRLLNRLSTLNAQLDDPALANHPRAAAAALRAILWRGRIVALEERAQRLLPHLARAWDRLPARRKTELRQHPEWDGAVHGHAAALAAWCHAKREAGVPIDGCPF